MFVPKDLLASSTLSLEALRVSQLQKLPHGLHTFDFDILFLNITYGLKQRSWLVCNQTNKQTTQE